MQCPISTSRAHKCEPRCKINKHAKCGPSCAQVGSWEEGTKVMGWLSPVGADPVAHWPVAAAVSSEVHALLQPLLAAAYPGGATSRYVLESRVRLVPSGGTAAAAHGLYSMPPGLLSVNLVANQRAYQAATSCIAHSGCRTHAHSPHLEGQQRTRPASCDIRTPSISLHAVPSMQ